MMKKILSLLAIALFAISCNKNGAAELLVASAAEVNATCPMAVDELTTIESVSYNINDPYFVYNYTIDETACPVDLVDLKEAAAEGIKSSLDAPEDKELKEFLKTCINADVLILYQYVGTESNEGFGVIYNPKTKEVTLKE